MNTLFTEIVQHAIKDFPANVKIYASYNYIFMRKKKLFS